MSPDRSDSSSPAVAILGGGVVGISTAIYLELYGYDTTVYTDRVPFESDPDPAFATPYAAASVQPASVTMRDLPRVFGTSQAVFRLLADAGSMGVRRQPHFVLYEVDRPDPDYATVVDGFERVSDLEAYPRRPDAAAVFGWRFDAYFAEMPAYLGRCYALYRAIGGTVTNRTLTRREFLECSADVLANCTGVRATELFDDPRPFDVEVGHQVIAEGLPPVRDASGSMFSYKYTPDDEEIGRSLAGEVYAYPRMDALVLGGSRIVADIGPGDRWEGELDGATRTIDGVTVPARIVETNAELLETYADVDLRGAAFSGRYGYRPVRDPDGEGVRLERERIDGRPVVHNYGHGGAGVTLSWGSAAETASLVRELLEPDPKPIDVGGEFAVAERLAETIDE
ncbi:FAD-dependent oxidoreductase [Natronorubrum sp. FCH18a]|uniref:FAD-dependent oxidoreductase n=1 Tax=Natronorubrum sp. FCH18a TaxID=3447018 RepID=UPI003F51920F